MKIKFICAYYDFWIGFFWDAKKKILYFFPIPTLGLKIHIFGKSCYVVKKEGYFYRKNAAGYTSDIERAGLFTLQEAKKYACSYYEPAITMHHVKEFIK